jgi:hypothetical protein
MPAVESPILPYPSERPQTPAPHREPATSLTGLSRHDDRPRSRSQALSDTLHPKPQFQFCEKSTGVRQGQILMTLSIKKLAVLFLPTHSRTQSFQTLFSSQMTTVPSAFAKSISTKMSFGCLLFIPSNLLFPQSHHSGFVSMNALPQSPHRNRDHPRVRLRSGPGPPLIVTIQPLLIYPDRSNWMPSSKSIIPASIQVPARILPLNPSTAMTDQSLGSRKDNRITLLDIDVDRPRPLSPLLEPCPQIHTGLSSFTKIVPAGISFGITGNDNSGS